jgi:YHS domain-containing protein
MFRTLFIEFLLPLLLFLVLRSFLRSMFAGSGSQPRQAEGTRPTPVQSGGELKKDPVCGTYVSTAASVTRTVRGEVVHFCSKECRDKYPSA